MGQNTAMEILRVGLNLVGPARSDPKTAVDLNTKTPAFWAGAVLTR
jgi:hypothetical protein